MRGREDELGEVCKEKCTGASLPIKNTKKGGVRWFCEWARKGVTLNVSLA